MLSNLENIILNSNPRIIERISSERSRIRSRKNKSREPISKEYINKLKIKSKPVMNEIALYEEIFDLY